MKIGFIGLGIMGESMCENIVKKHNDSVYASDINKKQVEKLAGLGAIPCENNVEVAKNADLIITMVPKSEHVKAVYTELLPYIDETKICIDMSTIDPAVSIECAKMIKAKGAQFADCPVVKSKPAAIDGTLGILIGADEELVPTIKPILSQYIQDIVDIYSNYGFLGKTEIICAAVRTGKQIVDCAVAGADIVTAGLQVFKDSFFHPYTDFGLSKFQAAWDNTITE